MYLAGVDIGTSGCKCSIYDFNGQFICEEYREYSAVITKYEHTIDPNMIWENVCDMLKHITIQVNEITAICVTSFGEASVLLDVDDKPILQSYLFSDPNGEIEVQEIIDELGSEYISKITGLKPEKVYSSVKWKWILNNKPYAMKKCNKICLFSDYIVYKLTGNHLIDYSLASRTLAFDIRKLEWNEDILNSVGVDKIKLGKPVPSGTNAGYMKKDLASDFGFKNQPMVVVGCHDQVAAAIGTGCINANMAVDGTGTVECITPVFKLDSLNSADDLIRNRYSIVPFIKDLYVTYAFSYTGGALLKWYRDKIADFEAEIAKKDGENPFLYYNKSLENAPSDLLILPYFSGAGTPYMNGNAKGVIIGLTMETTKNQIYQGLMEGVTYEMKLNMEKLSDSSIFIDKMYATGGGAMSSEWLQMKADILGIEIVSLGAAQSGTLGCVMLAAVACGCYDNLEEAKEVFVNYVESYKPRKEISSKYKTLYERYKKIYPTIKDI